MPFIPHNERVDIAQGKPAETVGQLCYIEYVKMVAAWNKTPGWTTAHNIYRKLVLEIQSVSPMKPDQLVAQELAWQAFWSFYVLPYEIQKEKDNGGI